MRPARVVLAAALLLTAIVVEVVWLARLPLPGATPDLVLLVVIGLAFVWGPVAGAFLGFTGGLLIDVVPPADGTVGLWALVCCLCGFAAGLTQDLGERSAVFQLAAVAGLAAATLGAYGLLSLLTGDPRVTWSAVLRTVPWAVAYVVFLTPFVVPGLARLAGRVEPQGARP